MAVRPQQLIYAVDETPPLPRLAMLGLQYSVLISVYLIFIVMLAKRAGVPVEIARHFVGLGLIACAVGAVLQSWRGHWFGSGYLAPPCFSAIYFVPSVIAVEAGGLPAVAAMTIFAALVEGVLSRFVVRLRVVFQPLIAGFTVFVVGIQLGFVGILHVLDVADKDTQSYSLHVAVASLTLAACIGFSIWGRGVVRLASTLLGLVIGVVAAILGGLFDPDATGAIMAAPWIDFPDPRVISWSFDPALVPAFVAAGLAATLRVVGAITTAQRINDAAWKRPDMDNIQRGVLGDALGCLVGGLLGGPGMSIAPSFIGVSEATRATSRVIAFVAAAFLFAVAFIPKITSAVIALPLEVAGAVLVFTSSFLIASGVQIMTLRGLDLRGGFAISVAFLLGLAVLVYPAYFDTLPVWIRPFASAMLTLSLLSAIVLTFVFRVGIREKEAIAWQQSDAAREDFAALLDRHGKEWKLDPELLERAKDTVASLVEHLKSGQFLTEPVTFKVSYDTLELEVDLVYRGRPLPLTAHTHHELAHEESAVTSGLGSYVLGLHADRSSVATHGDAVTIRLWFAA